MSNSTLSADMKTMINCKDFADIRFLINNSNREIYGHKCILYCRRNRFTVSQIFPNVNMETLIQTPTTTMDFIQVHSSINISTFLDILEFIYTGNYSVCDRKFITQPEIKSEGIVTYFLKKK